MTGRFKAYFAGYLTLCALCCAVPYVFVTLGVMSVSMGAYFGRVLEVLLSLGVLSLLGYFVWRMVRAVKQREA